jgi:hypothetical protein
MCMELIWLWTKSSVEHFWGRKLNFGFDKRKAIASNFITNKVSVYNWRSPVYPFAAYSKDVMDGFDSYVSAFSAYAFQIVVYCQNKSLVLFPSDSRASA